jgi:5-methylthioadenosine/S-adenosylhomocysteine deaminase
VHVSAAEIDRLARTGTAVVASPVAEMKLADGVSPLAEMLGRGVTVALGTDAAVCNNGCDLFAEMKTAALVQKLTRGARVLPAEQVLGMATRGGARALGLGERLGAIVPGHLADLVLVDGRGAAMRPLIHNRRHSNVVANLVHAATSADVADVMVGGEWRVRERRHLRLDLGRALDRLQRSALALHRALEREGR